MEKLTAKDAKKRQEKIFFAILRGLSGYLTIGMTCKESEKCPKMPPKVQKNEAAGFLAASSDRICYNNDQNSNFSENT